MHWRKIPELPLYEASDDGAIRSKARIMRVRQGQTRYRKIVPATVLALTYTYLNGQPHYITVKIAGKTLLVHRLVASAWHSDSRFPGAEVNHKNGNKQDNRSSNLEWITHQENVLHAYRTLGNRHKATHRGSQRTKAPRTIACTQRKNVPGSGAARGHSGEA